MSANQSLVATVGGTWLLKVFEESSTNAGGCGKAECHQRGRWAHAQGSDWEGREEKQSKAWWRLMKQNLANDVMREVMEYLWELGGEWLEQQAPKSDGL